MNRLASEAEVRMYRKSTRILLIEDDASDHLLLRRSLLNCRMPCELTWSDRLSAGIEALASRQFDVVLTDLSLPDAKGLDAVRQLRDCDAATPIVVLTTLDDPAVETQAIEHGAQDYLVKGEAAPFALERVITHAIQRQESFMQIERLLVAVRDNERQLSEQKQLLERKNRRLRKLYKMAHRFVDNVSHEFRTPLAVIKDYVALVREGMVGEVNDEQRQMLDVAAVRTIDLNNMVDDMLDVSRLQSGMLGAWRRRCRLSEIIAEVMPALVQKAAIKNIDFSVDDADDLPDVYCDGEKIGRVIINLATNAMKFCGDPGRVELWTRANPANEEIVVGVTDNGPGIEPPQLELLFKRFKQLNRNGARGAKGFGLGLSIAKELVALNFGEIQVDSIVGRGSTFSFTIPTASPPAVVRRYLDKLGSVRSGSGKATMLTAEISASASEKNADEIDAFLNYLLREQDLLFRRDRTHWLFILAAAEDEIDGYRKRVKREFCKANRNRPFGALPKYELRSLGTWDARRQCDALLDEFDPLFRPLEPASTA
jgi:hypothetical protein